MSEKRYINDCDGKRREIHYTDDNGTHWEKCGVGFVPIRLRHLTKVEILESMIKDYEFEMMLHSHVMDQESRFFFNRAIVKLMNRIIKMKYCE